MAANYNNVLSKTDKALNDFTSVARAEEIRLLDQAIAMIKELETDAKGNIKPSIANMRKIVVIKARIEKACDGKEYLAGIKDMLKSFDGIYQDQREYFSKEFTHKAIEGRVADKAIVLKKLAADNTIDGLTRAGLSANVTNKLNDMITRAVTTGAHFPDLVKEMQAYLSPDGAEGALSKYANTYATTAMSQYVGQNNKLMTEGIETDWFMYVGSNIETTREFCQHLSKKKWVHVSELPEIIKGHIDGHECALNKKTGLPNGMIEGTTIENFQVNVGGWNCGHAFVPVHRLAVPADVRAKFEAVEPANDWERWKIDHTNDLNLYRNEIRLEYGGLSTFDKSMANSSYNDIQDEWDDYIHATLKKCSKRLDKWNSMLNDVLSRAINQKNSDASKEANRLLIKYNKDTLSSSKYFDAVDGEFDDDYDRLTSLLKPESSSTGNVSVFTSNINDRNDVVREVDIINQKQRWFRNGSSRELVVTRRGGCNGCTDMRGRIELTKERAIDVLEAFKKISLGQQEQITTNEADAMATYWHEITHNRHDMSIAKDWGYCGGAKSTRFMELANEYIARKTMDEFYRSLGCAEIPEKAKPFVDVRSSTGYNRMVVKYDKIIKHFCSGREREAIEMVKEGLYYGNYADLHSVLSSALLKYGLEGMYYDKTSSRWSSKDYEYKTTTKRSKVGISEAKKIVTLCENDYTSYDQLMEFISREFANMSAKK